MLLTEGDDISDTINFEVAGEYHSDILNNRLTTTEILPLKQRKALLVLRAINLLGVTTL